MGLASSVRTNRPKKARRPRIEERTSRTLSSIDSFDKRLQDLQMKAAGGDFQSQIRLEAIGKLLDPSLSFTEKDLAPILNTGYPIKVERGLKLYRTMSKLIVLCEPLGDRAGATCRVRLIDFENLTWERLLDIRGSAFGLLMRAANKHKNGEKLDGLRLLSPEEQQLYKSVKPYFGGRKRPTLKYVARALIGGRDAKITDKTVLSRLAAVRNFRREHKRDLGFSWYFIGRVESFGHTPITGRELIAEMQLRIGKALAPGQNLSKLRAQIAKAAEFSPPMQERISTAVSSALETINHTALRSLRISFHLGKK